MRPSDSSAFRVISADRAGEFVARGHRRRRFFPHRVYRLPKCGPDGFRLAQAMCGNADPSAMRQLLLYADESLLMEFPRELFFDDELNWHREQFGRPGQVASASLVMDGETVYGITYVSDLVQRIGLRREHKTRVEKVFEGWRQMLFNAVLAFALEQGARRVLTPTAELAMRHTDAARRARLGPEMYERIYDRTVTERFAAGRSGDWWLLEADDFREQVVELEPETEPRPRVRTICVCHDIERGLGHLDGLRAEDADLARQAELSAPGHLEEMQRIEAEAGVRATYAVVGTLLPELQAGLEDGGHALAFHSFDHRIDDEGQLPRCREVDYRIKGYRPPRSILTSELSDRNLLFHNFEWLASSGSSLGVTAPELRGGVVTVPIDRDDYALYADGLPYAEWEGEALTRASEEVFTAISLHDCYADRWLPGYGGLLEQLGELGELRTLDEVAAEVTLGSGS